MGSLESLSQMKSVTNKKCEDTPKFRDFPLETWSTFQDNAHIAAKLFHEMTVAGNWLTERIFAPEIFDSKRFHTSRFYDRKNNFSFSRKIIGFTVFHAQSYGKNKFSRSLRRTKSLFLTWESGLVFFVDFFSLIFGIKLSGVFLKAT